MISQQGQGSIPPDSAVIQATDCKNKFTQEHHQEIWPNVGRTFMSSGILQVRYYPVNNTGILFWFILHVFTVLSLSHFAVQLSAGLNSSIQLSASLDMSPQCALMALIMWCCKQTLNRPSCMSCTLRQCGLWAVPATIGRIRQCFCRFVTATATS